MQTVPIRRRYLGRSATPTTTPVAAPAARSGRGEFRGASGVLAWLRISEPGLLILATLVGAGAGVGAIAFRWLIVSITRVVTGAADYTVVAPAANPHLPGLGRYFVVLAPVAVGLCYGPLVHFFAREARGHGVPEVMYAVARKGGRIPPQVAVVKALASALCIGGGGSVGREGPIVQIGSALGSTLGRLTRVVETRMRVLVACGAAGGIAATFNAPLAGVFFAMELILRDFAAQAFGMVVLSSVTASVIGRAALGNAAFLRLPTFQVHHVLQYPLYAALGLLAGVVGVGFTRALYFIEDACDHLWRGPEWLRPAVGGVLLGGLLLVLPEMYGVGYPVLGKGVAGKYTIAFLGVLLLGKIVATSLTIGIGGSGGVFAPSLFVGAMLGAGFGEALQHAAPAFAGPVGSYGLIGMGAVFAGAARAPITAVIIMFELTGEYAIILPLMTAIVLATGISHLLSRDTIYTLKLSRRGVDLDQPSVAALHGPVSAVAEPLGPVLPADTTALAAAGRLGDARGSQLAVVDEHGGFVGLATARAIAEALADGEHDDTPVGELLEFAPTVRADDPLDSALTVLDTADRPLPVLDGDRVTGWLTHQCILNALRADGSLRGARR